MNRPQVTVTLTLEINDVHSFRRAAYNRALDDGADDASLYLAEKTLAECAQMLLDPGMGPDGSNILESECSSLVVTA